ncbi:MAG: hypothetical protein JKX85_04595, partial [Phycisphaeraceae bacterium]|nr:hypothetical protein [Phycisphaeraceae bacterium]
SFDPADTGDAKAIVSRHGYVVTAAELLNDGDITQAIPWAYNKAFLHQSEILRYDADGMGSPVMKLTFNAYAQSNLKIVPYYGSGEIENPERRYGEVDGVQDFAMKKNKDTFLNFRAQAATWLRDRFEQSFIVRKQIESGGVVMNIDFDRIISLDSNCENFFELVAELSRQKRIYTDNGKIKVESKKAMKARSVESPNLFDACKMAFATKMPRPRRVNQGRTRTIRARDRGLGL